ncbi:MAG TPA: DUF6542 domain-containing protein [Trebonia sp.]
MDRDRPFGGSGGAGRGFSDLSSGGLPRWLGRMPTWMAVAALAAGAVLGVIFSVIADQEPGILLGLFVIIGSIVAAIGIKRGKVYLLFPAPALAFFVAAILAGKVHDAKLGSSTAGLGAGFTQWIAGIFFPAVVATILVLLIGGGRWLLGHQLVTGQSALSAPRPAPGKPRQAPGSRRPGTDDWAEDAPFGDSSPRTARTGPGPRQNRPAWMGDPGASNPGTSKPGNSNPGAGRPGASNPGTGNPGNARPPRPPREQRTDRGQRPDRNQRADRDQWGDPRPPADRNPPAAPRPRPNGQPQPRAPRPSNNPPRNPAPNPQRPRRQPPEGWTQR